MKREIPLVKVERIAKKIVAFIGYSVILMSLVIIVVGMIKKEVYLLGAAVLLPSGIAIVFFARMLSLSRKS
ncbi:hypothetical protein ACFL6S_18710 [Candidatus Poribacteria bacterium]